MNTEQTQTRIVNPTVWVRSDDLQGRNRLQEIGGLPPRERRAALLQWQHDQQEEKTFRVEMTQKGTPIPLKTYPIKAANEAAAISRAKSIAIRKLKLPPGRPFTTSPAWSASH